MWNIEVGYIQEWLDSLDEKSYTQVIVSLKILEEKGPTLGRPLVDKIKTSKHSNMKELRPGSS